MSDPPSSIESIETLLLAEHALIEELGRSLVAATIVRDEEVAREVWNQLRPILLVHVDGEDRYLMPALTRRRPQEARALLAEHRLIRDRIREIDAAFGRGDRPLKTLRAFVDELSAHARHEARVLYAHCDAWLDDNERALLVAYRETASKASSAASSSSTFTGFVK